MPPAFLNIFYQRCWLKSDPFDANLRILFQIFLFINLAKDDFATAHHCLKAAQFSGLK